ncbi:MAG TPA: hypothetical protein VN281_00155, partial [Verrucomicrobiae bacterium]|nr:hypothetical protein [Verrucomicrobiae bacterium]
IFVPAGRTYSPPLSLPITGQNFLFVRPQDVTVSLTLQDSRSQVSWFGINGVNYVLQYSSDLTNWTSYVYGKGTGQQIYIYLGHLGITLDYSGPQMFFRVVAEP